MKRSSIQYIALLLIIIGCSNFKAQSQYFDLEDEFSLIYDDDYYKSTYSDIAKAYGSNNAFEHFIIHGMNEWRKPSAIFDPIYYKNKYSDLQDAFGDDAYEYYKHFMIFGMYEMRQASETFDPVFYKSFYKDLRDAFGSDNKQYYFHYLDHGKNENRLTLETPETASQRANVCKKCNGTGSIKCSRCDGYGETWFRPNLHESYGILKGCRQCGGGGSKEINGMTEEVYSDNGFYKGSGTINCPTCGGSGYQQKSTKSNNRKYKAKQKRRK